MIKTNFFEPTIWTEQKNPVGRTLVNKSDFQYDDELIIMDRRIERAVLSQIAKMNGKDPELYLDKHGVLRYNICEDLTDEQSRSIWEIFEAYRGGVFARHQFQDFRGEGTKAYYAKWFDLAKESYLYTMPLKQILSLSDWDKSGCYTRELENTFDLHNGSDELSRVNAGLGYYTINQLKGYLEGYFEPYVMLSIIGKNVHIEEFDGMPYMVCNINKNKKIAISFFSKEVFEVSDGKLLGMGNSYEYVFKKIGMPIETVLNSVVGAIDPYKLPGEGMGEYRKLDTIEDKVKEAVDSADYSKARSLTRKSYYFDFR